MLNLLDWPEDEPGRPVRNEGAGQVRLGWPELLRGNEFRSASTSFILSGYVPGYVSISDSSGRL